MTWRVSCTASWLGSKVGFETIARIAPVFGSIATTAPWRSPSASHAACCTTGSIVSLDGGALRVLPGEDGVELVEELLVRGAAQVVVERALDAGVALIQGEVSGDRRVQRALRVDPLVLVRVVDRHRLGDRLPVDQDRPALGREARVEGAHVAAVGAELVRLDDLDDRGRGEEREEHRQHDDADPAEFLVHEATSASEPTTRRG